MLKINVDLIKNWLYESGFEQGVKDKDLQKPLIALAGVLVASYIWSGVSLGSIQSAAGALAEQQERTRLVKDYQAVLEGWETFGKDTLLPKVQDSREWVQSQVTAFASDTNVEVAALESGGAQTLGTLVVDEYKVTIQGSFDQIGRFVAKLEGHKPLIGISNFQFNRGERFDPGRGRILTVTLSIFSLKETPLAKTAGARDGN